MMSESAEDEGLITRAVGGDRAAFAALVSHYYDMIFRVAWKSCGNREDAQDIAQDVCVRLGRTIRSYDGRAQFSTWLYRVVLNGARDHLRRNASEMRKREDWAAQPHLSQHLPGQEFEEEEKAAELWTAVRRLPEKQRDTLLLVYGEGLSHAQAAEALDCATGTIASNIHDARKRLKALLVQETKV